MMKLYVRGRRRFRNLFVTFLTVLGIFLIVSFVIRSDSILTATISRKNTDPQLFCVLLHTHSTHEQFIYWSNITWAKHCHKLGIIRYKRFQRPDDDSNFPESSYHVNLWTRILVLIRQFINQYEYISNNDLLIIVPAPTFVFQEKLPTLLNAPTNNSHSPLIIIQEYQDANAYILNGQALNLVRNTKLIDSCLEQSYPSARETHLWKCVKSTMHHEQIATPCENKNCFVHYQRYRLTSNHIKNGSCLQDNLHLCRSIALLYPLTLNDFITLEFFKYKLKRKPSN